MVRGRRGLAPHTRGQVLEPQDRERARHAAEAPAGRGDHPAARDGRRADPRRGGAPARNFGRRFSEFPQAAACLERDWEALTAFYDFPAEHWKHLRTSNVVESPFASLRLRSDAAKRFKVVANATMLIWKVLRVAESRWRRLDAPDLLKDVYEGREFADGMPVTPAIGRKAA